MRSKYGNLGDHAIAFSEAEMLQKEKILYIELTGSLLQKLERHNLLNVMNGYNILINGGGNLGTLWSKVEKLQREVIIANPDSGIFIFPNTIYYEQIQWGKE